MRLDASWLVHLGLLACLAAVPAGAQRIVVLDEDEKREPRSARVDVTVDGDERDLHIRIRSDSLAGDEGEWEEEQGEDMERARARRHASSDRVVFGQDLRIDEDQIVAGDAVAIFGSVHVAGQVNGDVVSIGGEVTLAEDAVVRGDCVAVGGGAIRAADGSQIHGEAVAVGGRILEDPGAHIARRVAMSFVPAMPAGPMHFFRGGWWIFFAHLIFVGLIGFALAKLSDRRWRAAVATLKARSVESLLAGLGAGIIWGILGVPLLVAVMIALIAVVVGIPLVPLVVFLLIIFPIPGYLVTSALLGGAVRRDRDTRDADPGTDFLLGHLMLSLLWFLAILLRAAIGAWFSIAGAVLLLGWGVIWLAVAFGWGAFLLSRFGMRLPAGRRGAAADQLPPAGAPVSPAP